MTSDTGQTPRGRLRELQNRDGGWGYFPGKQSWLEPTCYCLLALYGDSGSHQAWTAGWKLIRSWQLADGSFRSSGHVQAASWATALVVSLSAAQGRLDTDVLRAVQWMLGIKGVEGSWEERALNAVWKLPVEYDRRFKGWPWCPDASSWIEPTAHSLLALKKIALQHKMPGLGERIVEGERMLLDRRTPDGGWNYGNRRVLKTDLPSYPETTAVALLGLQGTDFDRRQALEVGRRHYAATRSRLAQAWLRIAFANYGVALPAPAAVEPTNDVMIAALEALAGLDGGHQWLKV